MDAPILREVPFVSLSTILVRRHAEIQRRQHSLISLSQDRTRPRLLPTHLPLAAPMDLFF